MTPFATITPTRKDRPELLDFCKYQLSRMTVKPDKTYFVDYPPRDERIDIVDRVRVGVELAKHEGFNTVFIVEDDDFYPANYFEKFDLDNYTFWGSQQTWYYNLKNRTFVEFNHPNRSSLFNTGFKISALNDFRWEAVRNQFLDIAIWEYASSGKQFVNTGSIGIKHALGLCGGKGHKMRHKNEDPNLEWLKSQVDFEAFEFYSELTKKL